MANKTVTISQATNGFIVVLEEYSDDSYTKSTTFVATSVQDTYSFGSVSLAKVLGQIFNPPIDLSEPEGS